MFADSSVAGSEPIYICLVFLGHEVFGRALSFDAFNFSEILLSNSALPD